MLRRIYVRLTDDELAALAERAKRERRHPSAEAGLLLARLLKREAEWEALEKLAGEDDRTIIEMATRLLRRALREALAERKATGQ